MCFITGRVQSLSSSPSVAQSELSSTPPCPTSVSDQLPISGVDVGHQFFSPCEMVTVGFHNHWLSGIDYIGASFQQLCMKILRIKVDDVLTKHIVKNGQGFTNYIYIDTGIVYSKS
ncbi:putative histone-lysine N-methyltransferase [Helianthus annuus]|uniref:Histone-lysine N-methyltransferase n=1 Tax=Helianthus annuus TaxID=4232 RepID=A0A9K3IMR6_HELAN|nr:putative histone-lysine N-methyltransferase [Helianthus annuus]